MQCAVARFGHSAVRLPFFSVVAPMSTEIAFHILNRPVTWDEIGYALLVAAPILAALSVYWDSRRQK